MAPLAELANAVATLLKAKRHTIAVAESSAGGLINATLVAVPGASAYYLGGGVIYTTWQLSTESPVCPKCNRETLIPSDSPKAAEFRRR